MKRFISLTLVLLIFASLAVTASAAEENTFVHYKTGNAMTYKTQGNTAYLGDGTNSCVSADTEGSITVPANVTYFEKQKTVTGYEVEGISSNAFAGCDKITDIYIEGDVTLSENSLSGLAENVTFTTGSKATCSALLSYGIDASRIIYDFIETKYVVLGDSIAAGYSLDEYNDYDASTPEIAYDGDKFPTPSDAFVTLVSNHLKNGGNTVVTDQQALSGSTSWELLADIQEGNFDKTLESADIITVTVGSNDILLPFIDAVTEAVNTAFPDGITDIEDITGSMDLLKIRTFLGQLATAFDIINESFAEGGEGYQKLMENADNFKYIYQPAILEELHKRAPEAQIYWTTLYNPFEGEVIDANELFPELAIFGSDIISRIYLDLDGLSAMYVEQMNTAFDTNTEGYIKVDLYEDFSEGGLTNVSIYRDNNGTPLDSSDDTFDFNVDPHPNKDGHKVIADNIIEALDANYTPKTEPAEGFKLGDANLDDIVNVRDATLIQKHSANIETINADGLAVSDVNSDGSVNVKDATAIQKHISGIDTGFKIGEVLV
ncbi:MAG: GDSL-type esterase/lipase family protein [Ruminococcus sp.]